MPELQDLIAAVKGLLSWPGLIGGVLGLLILYLWAALRAGAQREAEFERHQRIIARLDRLTQQDWAESPSYLRGQSVTRRERDGNEAA